MMVFLPVPNKWLGPAQRGKETTKKGTVQNKNVFEIEREREEGEKTVRRGIAVQTL